MEWGWLNPVYAVKEAWKMTKSAAENGGDKDKGKHKSVFSGGGKLSDPFMAAVAPGLSDWLHKRMPEKANAYVSGMMDKDPFINLDKKYGVGHYLGKNTTDWVSNKPVDVIAAVIGAIYGGGAALGAMGGGAAAGAGGAGGGTAGGIAGGGAYSAVGPWASGYVFPATSTFGTGGGFLSGLGGIGTGGAGAFSGLSSGVLAPSASTAAGTAAATPTTASNSTGMFDFQNMDWQDPNTYMKLSKMMPQQQQQQQGPTQQEQAYQRQLEQQQRQEWERYQLMAMLKDEDPLSFNSYLSEFAKYGQLADLVLNDYYA